MLIVDLVIVAIILLCVGLGYKRGFNRMPVKNNIFYISYNSSMYII